jgi:hypothetical protein
MWPAQKRRMNENCESGLMELELHVARFLKNSKWILKVSIKLGQKILI